MTEAEVIDKIEKLPAEIQQHLYLYVDFLYHTYSQHSTEGEAGTPDPDFFDKHHLTEAGKDWLEKRAEKAIAHPEKRLPWREAREKIHKKHNLPQ